MLAMVLVLWLAIKDISSPALMYWWAILEGGQGLGFGIALQHIFAFASQMRIPINRAQRFKAL
jgi:hypothetical protein